MSAKKKIETVESKGMNPLVEAVETGRFAAKAQELFRFYPAVAELHFTADGYAFKRKNDAENHAQSLKDAKIETVKR